MFRIFLSSVQNEFAEERDAVAAYIRGDALLRKHFAIFRFEELPSLDRLPDDVYLDEVDRSDIYLGLFGIEYGLGGPEGESATEREFDRATEKGLTRLIFVKGSADLDRDPRMRALIRKAQEELVRRRFNGAPDLTPQLYASLVGYLEERGVISSLPLDEAAHPEASMAEISAERVRAFLERARAARGYSVDPAVPAQDALTHMGMLDHGRPSNAALLLFGVDPQERFPAAETKCLRYHGTEVRKPIPSYQLYQGTLFEQVDQATDFVLSKLDRSVGTRDHGPEASRTYEIPVPVVQEAIVNAITHRDYTSSAGVQVHLFADRIEVMNPGALPHDITLAELRVPHTSHPRYHSIATAMYLAKYIEKAGTGTLEMIAGCRDAGLPEPDFREQGDHFVLTIWRDWLTEAFIETLGINDRQKQGLRLLHREGRVRSAKYQKLTGASRQTASRDLDELVTKGVLRRVGAGRGTHYERAREMPQK